jgi:hypothetical protein
MAMFVLYVFVLYKRMPLCILCILTNAIVYPVYFNECHRVSCVFSYVILSAAKDLIPQRMKTSETDEILRCAQDDI